MRSRRISGFLCAALILCMAAPAAFASEESLVPEETEIVLPEETDEAIVSEESVSVPESEPSPAAAEATPSTAEPATAEPAAEAAEAEAEPPVEEAYVPEVPDDPEAPRDDMVSLFALDGAAVRRYSDFTTRALAAGETLHRGIDVSAWQKTIQWDKVAAAGVEFVFIRGAYRGATTGVIAKDARFDEYIKGAKAAGLKVGVYVFSQAVTTTEAVEEADYLMSVVRGYDLDLPLVFDFEHYDGGRLSNAYLSKRAGTDICNAFCERAEQGGYDSMVYANPYMLNSFLYPNELGRLWLAHYTAQTTYSGRGYEYWQCWDAGSIDGISGNVDLDFWFEPSADGNPFRDIQRTDWYYDSVMTAYRAGVVNGVTSSSFSPRGTATRGQVVTMIYRMEGSPAWSVQAAFTDLTYDYYKNAVSWAAEKGVVSGYSKAEFRPERAITREELVTLLYRMKGSPASGTDLSAYGDAGSVQSYAQAAMAWAVENKIVSGYEDSTLRPRANATRAEVCTILMRYASLPA